MWKKLRETAFRFLGMLHRREDGQSMIEYGLIIALIAVVVVVALTLLGTNIRGLFTNIANSL